MGPKSDKSTMKREGISHVLLDIEGTTCPVSFVAGTLFPYATKHLESFVQTHRGEPEIGKLLAAAEETWKQDCNPEAQQLLAEPGADVITYLQLLIKQDRKLPELKDLQGLLWAKGYASGDLEGPLFHDVAPALRRWHQQGVGLAVYSSGSIAAQQLLYGHSTDGDLRNLFSHWFDTRTGAKQHVASYRAISQAMGVGSSKVLFISDSLLECEAAHAAEMQVLFSDRDGNPGRDNGSFERIRSYADLQVNP
jgi:enolase-phosphatase E1